MPKYPIIWRQVSVAAEALVLNFAMIKLALWLEEHK